MSQYTCMNCNVVFQTPAIQREHYKSDWHRFNLKRKLAGLPPITAEAFKNRVETVQLENKYKEEDKAHTYCNACKKSFSTEQSFQNHLQSKKHIELAKNIEPTQDIAIKSTKNIKPIALVPIVTDSIDIDDDDFETVSTTSGGFEDTDSDSWEAMISETNPVKKNDCLFCTNHSTSFKKNLKHMSIAHSFFVPYFEYVADLRGLLLYLGEKICQGYLCIWCGDRKNCFTNIEAVRNHMIAKGHAKIPMDTESSLEYLQFYNFNDVSDEENGDESMEDENTSRKSEDDPTTMVLPSGDVIGHRSLLRYFKQNPNISQKALVQPKKSKVHNLINYYRHLGWNPTLKSMVKKRVKDLKYLHFVQSKYNTQLSVKANKLQKHYRPQVDF